MFILFNCDGEIYDMFLYEDDAKVIQKHFYHKGKKLVLRYYDLSQFIYECLMSYKKELKNEK